jgi:G8 domain
MKTGRIVFLTALAIGLNLARAPAASPVSFNVRSARSGPWSDPQTWEPKAVPKAGDAVQIRPGHDVTYDVASDQALRVVHVGGKLTFARDRSTRLAVGLLKIEPGDAVTDDGFECQDAEPPARDDPTDSKAVLEIGTWNDPIPEAYTARIELVYWPGMDRETCPAIVNCGGRWETHGAPLSHTWVKLEATARPGDRTVMLVEPVRGWKAGDKIIVTASQQTSGGRSFRPNTRNPRARQTEERTIEAVQGASLTLDKPLEHEHMGVEETRSEVANLSRNVIIESADPDGVRGHTMFHRGSAGGISYAEFRHLGKEGVLGRYAIHFHRVRDTMRGSAVIGASIWDSHNRWITIHGTDYLLVRDCVGYQSVGHGFFLEDATEQYNLLDHNLAVQAYRARRLPKQVLPFDPNDGAGFWWANGRNTLVRNVACENDEYGFRFQIAKRSNFDPVCSLRQPDGSDSERDVRTLPFYRFEANESHSEGLYSFNFGDDANPSVHGDRRHPFIARALSAWETHYALRPNVQFFLLDGFRVHHGAYGVYHPDYDAQVYRNVYLDDVDAEPINRGHDDESIQYGTFTYDHLILDHCRVGRDPLIQLACTSPRPGQSGHFRNLTIHDSRSQAQVVDLGGGPRNDKLENGVTYYFHGYPRSDATTEVVSSHFAQPGDAGWESVEGFTGRDVRARTVQNVPFPALLDPVDDLPPATIITGAKRNGNRLSVWGVAQDDTAVASVEVNGRKAAIRTARDGVVDWTVDLEMPPAGMVTARARDTLGHLEATAHRVFLGRGGIRNVKRGSTGP